MIWIGALKLYHITVMAFLLGHYSFFMDSNLGLAYLMVTSTMTKSKMF